MPNKRIRFYITCGGGRYKAIRFLNLHFSQLLNTCAAPGIDCTGSTRLQHGIIENISSVAYLIRAIE